MGKARRALSRVVGGIQCSLGGMAAALVFLVYASSEVQEALSIVPEDVYLHMFLISVFSVFLILSGWLLISERDRGD
jgi:hypothetical protein